MRLSEVEKLKNRIVEKLEEYLEEARALGVEGLVTDMIQAVMAAGENGKGIMVINEIPESCEKCKIGRVTATALETYIYCPIAGKGTVNEETEEKPEWCPVRELPEKKAELPTVLLEQQKNYRKGWNDCVDAIMEEKEE